MISRQQLFSQIDEMSELDKALKEILLQEASNYPEQLSDEEIKKFAGFVSAVQEEELVTAQAMQDIVNAADQAEEEILTHEEQDTNTMLKKMRDELTNLQTVAA